MGDDLGWKSVNQRAVDIISLHANLTLSFKEIHLSRVKVLHLDFRFLLARRMARKASRRGITWWDRPRHCEQIYNKQRVKRIRVRIGHDNEKGFEKTAEG